MFNRNRRNTKKKDDASDSSSDKSDTSVEDSSSEHEEFCNRCGRQGELLCCDECPLVFHLRCLVPKLARIPKGKWCCPVCVARKDKEAIEKGTKIIQKPEEEEDENAEEDILSDTVDGDDVMEGTSVDEDIIKSTKLPAKRPLPPRSAKAKRRKLNFEVEDESSSSDEMSDIPDEVEDSSGSDMESPERDSNGNYILEEFGDDHLKFPFLNSKKLIKRIYPSSNVDKILTWMSKGSDKDTNLYLVKFEKYSYRKCCWIPHVILKEFAAQKLRNFDRQENPSYNDISDKRDILPTAYLEIDHIIAQKQKQNQTMFLTVWKGVPYDEATWEKKEELDEEMIEKFLIRNDPIKYLERLNETQKRSKHKFTNLRKQPTFIKEGKLKDYQLQGVSWLLSAWQKQTNVILADEMGLGKTVQTIAFLSMLHRYKTNGPFLVVVPVSTIRNWEREFAKWAPHIYLTTYTGNQEARRLIRLHEFHHSSKKVSKGKNFKFEVLLTSYNMIMQDDSTLRKFKYEVLVVDEAQRLKNQTSKLFRSLFHYDINFKLLLTGTPLQNTLQELFVLLHFLDPESFPSEKGFLSQFGDDVLTGEQHISKLHKLLAPHMLRRVKADVLDGLPGKEEFIVRVEMSEMQLEYYRAILTRNYNILCGTNTGRTTKISLTNIVTELQKCCNHPFLFQGAEPPTKSADEAIELLVKSSGKLLLLDKMLDRLKAHGHRVLIFSQMTRMLDILEDYLFYKDYSYERIDGSITGPERQERIDRFNAEDSDHFCFLLSTRAGGLGINLATADTVIIYDSDWNPHNDIQALSRAHRIGQEKRVMIYRMVTRSSVEESIIQRAKKKMMIEYLVVEKMGSKGETNLKKGELDDILRFGSEQLFKGSVSSITYDEDAIDRLLDRSNVGEKQEDSENYLNTFRVADYDIVEEEEQQQQSTDNEKEPNPKFWENLLGDSHEEMIREEEEQLGKGKRNRNQINYYGAGSSSKGTVAFSSPSTSSDEEMEELDDSNRRIRSSVNGEDIAFIEGGGKNMKIMGFSSNQRGSFLKLMMNHGIEKHFWDLLREKNVGFLRSKSAENLQEYCRIVLLHLLEPENNEPNYKDGCPKDDGVNIKAVLARIVLMYLIQQKIETNTIDDFDIKEGNWTDIQQKWKEDDKWTKREDYKFLQGVVKYGHSKWTNIMNDEELDLCQAALKQTRRSNTPKVTESGEPMPQIDEEEKTQQRYKPDKIVSRFLRNRLQLLEKALFIEFQLHHQKTAFDGALCPTTSPKEEAESLKLEEKEEKEEKEDEEEKEESPKAETIASVIETKLDPKKYKKEVAMKENISRDFRINITDSLATSLCVDEETEPAPDGVPTVRDNTKAAIDFLSVFGKMYDLSHHLETQLEQYSKELLHPEILEEALQEHYNGLQVLDNLVCESKFRLSKLHDGQFNK